MSQASRGAFQQVRTPAAGGAGPRQRGDHQEAALDCRPRPAHPGTRVHCELAPEGRQAFAGEGIRLVEPF